MFEQNTGAGAPSHTPLMDAGERVPLGNTTGIERKDDLRAGKGNQSTADHNEVQNVPQVTKIRTRMEEQSQVDHLE